MKSKYRSISGDFPWDSRTMKQWEQAAWEQVAGYNDKQPYRGTICIIQFFSYENEFEKWFSGKADKHNAIYSWNCDEISKYVNDDYFYFTIYPKNSRIAEKLKYKENREESDRYYSGIAAWGRLVKS